MLTTEQCQRALHAQVMWGGRLGTSLIELGFITDLDALSKALGRQHRHPAALQRHFDLADVALQNMLPTAVAERFECVPLMRVGKDKVIVAATSPLDDAARALVATALGIEPTGLLLSIAVELRIRYQMQQVYGIRRETRFLRSGRLAPEFPYFEILPVTDERPDLAMPIEIIEVAAERAAGTPAPAAARSRRHATPPEGIPRMTVVADPLEGLPASTTPPEGRERRAYLPTLGEKARDADRTAIQPTIALRRLAIGTDLLASQHAGEATGTTLDDATSAIRRGQARETVAELVIHTVARFVPSSSAAILMVVRGQVATGWAGFSRTGAPLPEIVVPIDVPGVVPTAIARNTPARASSGNLGAIDQLLLEILGLGDGDLVVVPIAVEGKVVGVIAMATEHEASIASAATIAQAAGAAFTRLMREALR